MLLTPVEIQELLKLIDRYTTTFVAHHVGTDILMPSDFQLLQKAGVNINAIKPHMSNVEQAFKFGILSELVSNPQLMSYPDLKAKIMSPNVVPLNSKEKAALMSLKQQTYIDINNLKDKMKRDVSNELVFADKKLNEVKHAKLVTDAAAWAVEERKSVNAIVSKIGHESGQWNRDLGRIAEFVLHTAMDEGKASGIERRSGREALVYKDVYAGACPNCIRLYLSGGAGSAPKIFKLSEIKGNGTNVGRKQKEWLPVIGPTHPFCRCTINNVPLGFTVEDYQKGNWEWTGTGFKILKYETKRKSKIKITVGKKG